MITIHTSNFQEVTYQKFKFPAGENHVVLNDYEPTGVVLIEWFFVNVEEFFELSFLVDVLKRHGQRIRLKIPYLPFARQDRATTSNQPFSLECFCKMLSTLEIECLQVEDVHSNVFFERMYKFCNFPVYEVHIYSSDLFGKVLDQSSKVSYDCLISPDEGASEKSKKWLNGLKMFFPNLQLVQAEKVRDPLTGKLSNPVVNFGKCVPKNILIVDDIIDGGGTFLQLFDVIKRQFPDVSVDLFCTFGIFSKGDEVLKSKFRNVVVSHDMRTWC